MTSSSRSSLLTRGRRAAAATAAAALTFGLLVAPAATPTAAAANYPCGKTGMRHIKTKSNDSVTLELYGRYLSDGTRQVCATAYKRTQKTKGKKLSLKGVKTSSTNKNTWVQRLDPIPTGVGLKFTATHTNDTVSYTIWND